MKKITLLILLISSQLFSATYFVDQDAGGDNSGTSWSNAFTDLQTAINTVSSGDLLFLKSGTYYPTQLILSGDNRSRSFFLDKNIKIYGGFDGTETTLNQRDFDANITILSGDFNGNDVDTNGNGINDFGQTENAYTVIFAFGLSNSARLDGVRITGGNADGSTDYTYSGYALKTSNAGAIYNIASNLLIKNVKFTNNSASLGGAIYNKGGSFPKIEDCEMTYNFASFGGCIYSTDASLTTITDSTFSLNRFSGGVITNVNNSVARITDCTFNNNSGISGGAIYNLTSSNAILMNVRIFNNTVTSSGGAIYNSGFSITTMYNTLIYGNSAQFGGAIYTASNAYVNLTNTTIYGNSASTRGGAFYCRISPDGMNARIYNSIVWGNTAPSSPNFFYEFFTRANIHVKNSILQGSGGSANWNTNYGADEGNNTSSDPLFVDTTNDSEDFALQPNSDGIDASYNQFLNLPNTNNSWSQNDTDVYGNSRLVGNGVDIGAAENSTLSIEESELSKKIFYYSESSIIFHDIQNLKNKDLSIYDMNGRNVFTSIINDAKVELPIMAKGIYILKIENNLGAKFIID